MKRKLILYNHYHNGDLFYSRVLIEMLKENFSFDYHHDQRIQIFSDIPEITEISGINPNFPSQTTNVEMGIINTWIGHDFHRHGNKINQGCTYENYFEMCKNICQKLGVDFSHEKKYLPKIYFSNLQDSEKISFQMSELKKKYTKIVFFSDGPVWSGQASGFSFRNHIENLSKSHEDVLFLTTHNQFEGVPNIINTSSITQKMPDLCELGLISTFCEIIVGRASGPYCFAQNEDNLLDANKTFVCFCNTHDEGKYFQDMKSKFFWSPTNHNTKIYDILEQSLNNQTTN